MDSTPGTSGSKSPNFVVGIGASAGGLEAIERFFDHMPSDSGAAFVLVQHLSPDFKSLMDELLTKHTKMSIQRVENQMRMEPDNIYLIPARKDMSVEDGVLSLHERDSSNALQLPIDIFFRSLAADSGDRAVAIVLSGTGSDGSRGIVSVKDRGGMVMVQDEESAKFDGMPRCAISTGIADFVMPPDKMPDKLMAFFASPRKELASSLNSGQVLDPVDGPLEAIYETLRRLRGIDFAQYKQRTIQRRIERRMSLLQIPGLDDYWDLFSNSTEEQETLLNDLLIGVTEFFRDPEVFDWLQDQEIPRLLENSPDGCLRVWVAACSSGEEAYTMAMLLEESRDRAGLPRDFKIFATDVDPEAILRASEGTYPLGVAASLTPERIDRFFDHHGDTYRVKRFLRQRIVFAAHNITRDPPFTRTDLVSCRNMLIYFNNELQARVLQHLHFSLKPKGCLVLGPSESMGAIGSEFEDVMPKWRIYSKKEGSARSLQPGSWTAGSAAAPPPPRSQSSRRISEDFQRACGALLKDFVPAALLVDRDFQLIHVFGTPDLYLRIPVGKMSNDVLRLFDPDARTSISTALHRARSGGQDVTYRGVRFTSNEEALLADIQIKRLKGSGPDSDASYLILLGAERRPAFTDGAQGDNFEVQEEHSEVIETLEQELRYTQENLQATIEELETANEELQSTNEELLASNEELQSTNEELHSVNEELYTVNAEHQNKIDELTELTDDIENLLSATEIGTIFLDDQLRIRKFTPAIQSTVAVMGHDIGRPIHDLNNGLKGVDLASIARQVHDTGTRIEREVLSRAGMPKLLLATPYRTPKHGVDGVVLSLIDLKEISDAKSSLRESERRFRELVEHLDDLFWMWVPDGSRLLYASPRLEAVLGVAKDTLEEQPFAWLERVHEADRGRVEREFTRGLVRGEFDFEFRVLDDDGGTRWIHSKGRSLPAEEGAETHVVGSCRDITERKDQEHRLVGATKKLESQALRDPLTALYNRRGAQRVLSDELSRVSRSGSFLTAVMVDLDNFKKVNDSLGHATGDLVLKGVSDRMSRSLRPHDVLCRIGGDEFLALLPETRPAEARLVAERLRLAISDSPLRSDDGGLSVTASLGVATIPDDVVSIEEVLVQTRNALSHSKRTGKNRVVLSQEQPDEMHVDPATLLHKISESGELRVYVQEIHSLDDDCSVAGYELLIRGPKGAYEQPYDLFRLSMESNLLGLMDLRCLKSCVAASDALQGNARVHVNMYPSTVLETPPKRLLALLEEHGGPGRFCIELSEQQFQGDPAHLLGPLRELRKEGVRIAIDDVGFGRSSLESLIVIEPDVMKIDRSFIHDSGQDQAKRSSLERLVRMTQTLSSEVVAEGVEVLAERDLLRSLDVRFAQGFLWGKPRALVPQA